jgi:hypothetical protein
LLKRLQQGAAHRLFSSSESPSASASASTHTAINAAAANSKSRTWDEHRLSSDQLQFRDLASVSCFSQCFPNSAVLRRIHLLWFSSIWYSFADFLVDNWCQNAVTWLPFVATALEPACGLDLWV